LPKDIKPGNTGSVPCQRGGGSVLFTLSSGLSGPAWAGCGEIVRGRRRPRREAVESPADGALRRSARKPGDGAV